MDGFIPTVATGRNVTEIRPRTWNKLASALNGNRTTQQDNSPMPFVSPGCDWLWGFKVDNLVEYPRYSAVRVRFPSGSQQYPTATNPFGSGPPEAEFFLSYSSAAGTAGEVMNVGVLLDPVPAGASVPARIAVSGLTMARLARWSASATDPYLYSTSRSGDGLAFNAWTPGEPQMRALWVDPGSAFTADGTPYLGLIDLGSKLLPGATVPAQHIAVMTPSGGVPAATYDSGTQQWTWGTANCSIITDSGLVTASPFPVVNVGAAIPGNKATIAHQRNSIWFVECCSDGGPVIEPDPGEGTP